MSAAADKENISNLTTAMPRGVGPRSGGGGGRKSTFPPPLFPSASTDATAAPPIAANHSQPAVPAPIPASSASAVASRRRQPARQSRGTVSFPGSRESISAPPLAPTVAPAGAPLVGTAAAAPALKRSRERGGEPMASTKNPQQQKQQRAKEKQQQQQQPSGKVLLPAPVAVPRVVAARGKKRRSSAADGVVAGADARSNKVSRHPRFAKHSKGKVRAKPSSSGTRAHDPPKRAASSEEETHRSGEGFDFALEDTDEETPAKSGGVAVPGGKERHRSSLEDVEVNASRGAARRSASATSRRRKGGVSVQGPATGVPTATLGKKRRGGNENGAGTKRRRPSDGGMDGNKGRTDDVVATLAPKHIPAPRGGPAGPEASRLCASLPPAALRRPATRAPRSPRGSWHLSALFGDLEEEDEGNLDTELLWRLSEDEDSSPEEAPRGRSKGLVENLGEGGGSGSVRGGRKSASGKCSGKKAARGKHGSNGGGGDGGTPGNSRDSAASAESSSALVASPIEVAGAAPPGRESPATKISTELMRKSKEEQKHVEALRALYTQVDSHRLSLSR